MADPEAISIFGRASELAAIAWFLGAVLEGPAALVLQGEAGIGKTALWEESVAGAAGRGCVVLRVRAGPADAELPFSGLTELLDPIVDRVLPELSPPLVTALNVALLRQEPQDSPPDRRAIFMAVARAIQALAQDGITVVAIDDFQWLDRESADALRFAAHRVGISRIGLLLARRADEREPAPLDLDRALPDGRLRQMWLQPLTLEALQRLLRSRAGYPLARPVAARVHEASGGNPFYALEITRMIASGAIVPQPGEPLPLPAGARGVVMRRLEALPPAVRAPLIAAALMARPTIRAVAAVADSEPASWVDPAAGLGLIRVQRGRVSFTHPLLASGIIDLALPEERRALHARIAGVLTDREERAVHLARSVDPPDEHVAAALEESARLASRRGARLAAAERFHQSFQFAPVEARAARVRRSIEACEAYRDAGSGEHAMAVVSEALEGIPAGPDRARLLLAMARAEALTDPRGLVEEALSQAGADSALKAQILIPAAELDWLAGDLVAARDEYVAAAGLAAGAGDSETELRALGYAGAASTLLAAPGAVDLLARAQALEGSVPKVNPWARPGHWLAVRALWHDDLEAARRGLELELRRAEEEGNEFDQAGLSFHLAQLECRAGHLAKAARYSDFGYEFSSQYGGDQNLGADCSAKALAQACLGHVDVARAAADEGIRAARAAKDRFFEVHLRSAVAFLEVSLGNYAAAAEISAGLPEVVVRMGVREPGVFPFLPDRIEALVALGGLGEAEALTGQWEALGGELARPRLLATGARCRALCHAARGDIGAAQEAVLQALTHHSRFPVPLELGRTLVVHGQVLRRLKKKSPAREALERARSIFADMGAQLWVARAGAELSRIGGRAPSGLDLTPAEREVAEAVAAGATNRETADRLFMSVNTVEATLSRVYRKLSVRSRTELAKVLRERSD